MAGIFQRGGKLLRDGARLRGCCCEPWVVYVGCITGGSFAEPVGDYMVIDPAHAGTGDGGYWRVGVNSWNASKAFGNIGLFGICRKGEFRRDAYFWSSIAPAGTGLQDMVDNPFDGFSVCRVEVFGEYLSEAMARAVCETWRGDFEDAVYCESCEGCAGTSAAAQTQTFTGAFGGEILLGNSSPCADRKITVDYSGTRAYLHFAICPESPNPPTGNAYWGGIAPRCTHEGSGWSGTLVASVAPLSALYLSLDTPPAGTDYYTATVTMDAFSAPACPAGDPLAAVPRNAEEFKAAMLSRRLEGEL